MINFCGIRNFYQSILNDSWIIIFLTNIYNEIYFRSYLVWDTFSIKDSSSCHPPELVAIEELSLWLLNIFGEAVVGESGSGKSTAARVITGLLTPRLGSIEVKGEALPADYRNRDQLRHAQMIYQMADTALNPRQRIRDIIGRPPVFI